MAARLFSKALSYQFQKLSAGASSGFDAIPIPFIKHACLPVRCDGKFKQVNAGAFLGTPVQSVVV